MAAAAAGLHGVYQREPYEGGGGYSPQSPAAAQGLLLDLRGCDYTLGSRGTWINRATIGKSSAVDATVPSSVEFDEKERAFLFSTGGDVITVPLATNPHVLRGATYAVWVKARKAFANLAWIICQFPDHGWSRALTVNDYRLGHISVTTSQYWDSQLGQAPIGEWIHVAGVWHSDGTATVYLNGVRGGTAVTNNGKSPYCQDEKLIIGGRSPNDPAHNSAMLVSEVCVFGRALGDEEVRLLHGQGRTLEALEQNSLVLSEMSLNSSFGTDDAFEPREEKRTHPRQVVGEPIWDDATELFWCTTGVDAHDLPEGSTWQQQFRAAKEEARPAVNKRVLIRNGSDTPAPSPGRKLARFPSDPDKRASRAAHTEALRKMENPAGVELRLLGRNIALFRFDGRVFAVDAQCPHQGASLCEGEIGDIEDLVEGQRFYVRCKVHKMQFDLTTGAVIDGSCPPLRIYSARVRESATSLTVEVGFETLPEDYFAPDEDVDF